jgi:hypothetical protein
MSSQLTQYRIHHFLSQHVGILEVMAPTQLAKGVTDVLVFTV